MTQHYVFHRHNDNDNNNNWACTNFGIIWQFGLKKLNKISILKKLKTRTLGTCHLIPYWNDYSVGVYFFVAE